MASSPAEPSPTASALQELTACWDQGYEALAQGDLERVTALLDIADSQLRGLAGAAGDTPEEAQLRRLALDARGRLEHGMRSGLEAVHAELGKVRRGSRVLSGYRPVGAGVGDRVSREV
ncbi:MAG: hypothetical protein U1E73_03915 [Planctomycetota bacterium]